jgi:hypothetical protein
MSMPKINFGRERLKMRVEDMSSTGSSDAVACNNVSLITHDV